MSNVVRFKGETLPGEPVEEVIETLESLLEAARSGDIRAFAFAIVRENILATGWDGAEGTRYAVGSAVAMLSHRYIASILDGE